MIIRDFLAWTQNASASQRAEATAVLTRAYLYGNLSADQAWEAKTALLSLLDDPSPLVRRALAETCAASARTPRPLVVALACDVPEVARPVLARSPVLTDADLVDAAALGDEPTRAVIAARHHLSHAVSGGSGRDRRGRHACGARPQPDREDHRRSYAAHGGSLRRRSPPARSSAHAGRPPPPEVRHAIGLAVAQALSGFVTERGWLGVERCDRLRRETGERVALEACEGLGVAGIARLVAHLRTTQQLTAGLILRAVLSGRTDFAVAALSDLSGQDHAGVARAMRDLRSFADLHQRAGLPDALLPAMQAALAALQDMARRATPVRAAGLSRGIIECAINACNTLPGAGMQPVLVLLNRYEAEAARDEAREVARAIAAEAMARETARRNAQAVDAAWRAALESQRQTTFAPQSDAAEIDVAATDAAAEPHNPVGAILDALPEQILAWYRKDEPAMDSQAQAATEAVLDGLGDSLLDHFRTSHGLAPRSEPASECDKAKIAA